jgi:superfamily II DNA helicase RecQ
MDIRFSSPPLEAPEHPTEITTTGRNYDTYNFTQSSFNVRVRELEALTGLTLRPGQVEALQSLAEGKDVVLVAKTGYGKTLIFTGYNFLIPPTIGAITLIISPLVAIEQDQAEELKNRFGPHATPVVLDGKNNTAELRAEIARGDYTHVWASAEVVLADLVDCNKKSGTVRRSCVKRFDSGYIDQGSFHSVAQDEVFRRRLQLLAVDELHLCASTSWGGSFRTAMGQIAKLRDQLEPHTRMFGTTATLTPMAWENIHTNAGIRTGEHLQMIKTNIYREDVFLYILPTDDLKSTYKQILYTALERSPSAALLLRIIFFVDTQRDTILLRDDILRWLRGMNRWSNIASSYHGDLTTASRVHIHEKYFCQVDIVDRY